MKPFVVRISAILILSAATAAAECAVAQGIASPALANESQAYAGSETPMLKKWKLRMALALRDEAVRLQVADGGALSRSDRAYLQTRADLIRAQTTVPAY